MEIPGKFGVSSFSFPKSAGAALAAVTPELRGTKVLLQQEGISQGKMGILDPCGSQMKALTKENPAWNLVCVPRSGEREGIGKDL